MTTGCWTALSSAWGHLPSQPGNIESVSFTSSLTHDEPPPVWECTSCLLEKPALGDATEDQVQAWGSQPDPHRPALEGAVFTSWKLGMRRWREVWTTERSFPCSNLTCPQYQRSYSTIQSLPQELHVCWIKTRFFKKEYLTCVHWTLLSSLENAGVL